MKKLMILFLFSASLSAFAQDITVIQHPPLTTNEVENLCPQSHFFITSNSGVFHTPIGFKIGYGGKIGVYFGARFGNGLVYRSITTLTVDQKTLISVTGGITASIFDKGDFNLSFQIGGGYGQWWDYVWEDWTNDGYEIETGVLLSYKNFISTISYNFLDGKNRYSTHDLSLGVGYRF